MSHDFPPVPFNRADPAPRYPWPGGARSCLFVGFDVIPQSAGEINLNTTLGGNKVIGISYLDSSLVKNSDFVPLVRINYMTLTDATICIASM